MQQKYTFCINSTEAEQLHQIDSFYQFNFKGVRGVLSDYSQYANQGKLSFNFDTRLSLPEQMEKIYSDLIWVKRKYSSESVKKVFIIALSEIIKNIFITYDLWYLV